MPTIMVMPMREVMLNSVPVTHKPMKTPATANSGTSNIAMATRKLS